MLVSGTVLLTLTRALSKLPGARATTVLGLEHFRATARRRGLGAFVCDGIDRETVEGRGACQDHLRECSRRARRKKPIQNSPSSAGWPSSRLIVTHRRHRVN